MAKAIYAIMIVLFKNQLEVIRSMARGLQKVAIFVSLVFVKYWLEANIPGYPPKNDLVFMKILQMYLHKVFATVSVQLCHLSQQAPAPGFDRFRTHLIQDDHLKKVRSLKVVKNSAERAIALNKKFNSLITDEFQKQFLVRVVHHQRKMMMNCTKAACSS